MLPKNTKIKMGIFTSGASVRVIAECDLITQDNGHKDEAIYMFEISVMRDPRTEMTQSEIDGWTKTIQRNFSEHKFGFKASDRAQADQFIAYNTGKQWATVREFSDI